jgi:hypothetical protein
MAYLLFRVLHYRGPTCQGTAWKSMLSQPLIHMPLFEAWNIIRALLSSPNASFRALKRLSEAH